MSGPNSELTDAMVELGLPPGPVAFDPFAEAPLGDEVWLADRVGGAAELSRGTLLSDLGLDGDTLVQVFADGSDRLRIAFPARHMDPSRPAARTYGDLQDAFRDARAAARPAPPRPTNSQGEAP